MSGNTSILRLLAPRGCNWAGVRGGRAEINQATVAAALRGLSPVLVCLGYALWTDESGSIERLKGYVKQIIRMNGVESETDAIGLAESAVSEFLTREKCFRCNGTGQILRKDTQEGKGGRAGQGVTCIDAAGRLFTDCDQCNGTGIKRWSGTKRARMAGFDQRTYGRRYAGARDAGYRALCTWLEELASHLAVQLQEQ